MVPPLRAIAPRVPTLVVLCAVLLGNATNDVGAQSIPIRTETSTLLPMLDFQNRQSDKQTFLLEQNRNYKSPEVLLGTQFRGSLLFGSTNRRDKFPYLGRFPTDWEGTTASDARVLQANFDGIANFHPWITAYADVLYSDVFSFGDFKQGSFQVRQAYAVLGNADVTPWYGFIGKKNVSFGDFGTLSPFTQAVPWHYFAPLAEGAGIGFYKNGLHVVGTAINGSRGIRVADSDRIGHLNNFAINCSYEWNNEESGFRVGGGYLHGTIYDGATAEHLDATITGPRNGAWDLNATIKYKRLSVAGEFVQTQRAWPVTGSRITAYKAETAWDMDFGGHPGWLSASWSEGIQGAAGTPFEFNRQLVIGAAAEVCRNILFTMEYVESTGFAPLINITNVSDRDVRQKSVVLGMVFVL